jgi:hypothetical protein
MTTLTRIHLDQLENAKHPQGRSNQQDSTSSARTFDIRGLSLFVGWGWEFDAPPQRGGAWCFTRCCDNDLNSLEALLS